MNKFPQLGCLREVEQMLALSRQSSLRSWLLPRTIGQIQDIYRDADRLMEMMAVRCFMEPSGRMAQELSKELGTARVIWNANKERPLATQQELSSPVYADKVIVLEGGRQPTCLQRVMAFEDPALRDRLGPGRFSGQALGAPAAQAEVSLPAPDLRQDFVEGLGFLV